MESGPSSSTSRHLHDGAMSIQSTRASNLPDSGLDQVPLLQNPHHNNLLGRDRSDSWGTDVSSLSAHSSDIEEAIPMFTIAVLGSKGSGKSSVIKRALKGAMPTEPTTCVIPATETDPLISYSVRIGRRRRILDSTTKCFSVIELDTAALSKGEWPQSIPYPNGALLCYDAQDDESFHAIRRILKTRTMSPCPISVLACRGDLIPSINPTHPVKLKKYDVGVALVTTRTDAGKDKIRDTFDWIVRNVLRDIAGHGPDPQHHNPASPLVLLAPETWEDARHDQVTPRPGLRTPLRSDSASGKTPLASPPIVTEPFPRQNRGVVESDVVGPEDSAHRNGGLPPLSSIDMDEPSANGIIAEKQESLLRPPWWQTVDVLLDKFIFVCVSGDDPLFVSRFLLVHRCFTTPRSLILAIQKALRSLTTPSGDVIFAKFAQSRICYALDTWVTVYPGDFTAPNTLDALRAVSKTVASCVHLLHYASSILAFIETVPKLDPDAEWAFQHPSETSVDAADDEDEVLTEPDTTAVPPYTGHIDFSMSEPRSADFKSAKRTPSSGAIRSASFRDRKGSLPTLGASGPSIGSMSSNTNTMPSDLGSRLVLRDLLIVSDEMFEADPALIADEITRVQQTLFLDIKPRHWLLWMFRYGRKTPPPDQDPVTRFMNFSNHVAEWVASLILCHEKFKTRARQIERIIDIAEQLRNMNNFSACRSFVAGIRHCTSSDDFAMDSLMKKAPERHKALQSYTFLFTNHRAHGTYRQALRDVQDACIPDIEVHSSDILRAHTNNIDSDDSDSSKIHWAKWNLIAKFIFEMVHFQDLSRDALEQGHHLRVSRPSIAHMWREAVLMPPEMQHARMVSLPDLKYTGDHHDRTSSVMRGLKTFFR